MFCLFNWRYDIGRSYIFNNIKVLLGKNIINMSSKFIILFSKININYFLKIMLMKSGFLKV